MATPPCSNQACVWDTEKLLGPAPAAPASAWLAGPWHPPHLFPGVHLVPLRLQPVWGVRDGIGVSSFTFPAFTLGHHLGVCVLRPPSHEPAKKTEHRVSQTMAWGPHKLKWALSPLQKPNPTPTHHQGQALGRSLPHRPPSACLKVAWRRGRGFGGGAAAPASSVQGRLTAPESPGRAGATAGDAHPEPRWKYQKGDSSRGGGGVGDLGPV